MKNPDERIEQNQLARIEQLEKDAACYRWLRDRIGVTTDIGCAAGAYVWMPGGGTRLDEEDKRETDAAILRAIAKAKEVL